MSRSVANLPTRKRKSNIRQHYECHLVIFMNITTLDVIPVTLDTDKGACENISNDILSLIETVRREKNIEIVSEIFSFSVKKMPFYGQAYAYMITARDGFNLEYIVDESKVDSDELELWVIGFFMNVLILNQTMRRLLANKV